LSESIRAVERALDVLQCFSTQTPELNMTQISERVGMHKSTVHRLLATLEKRQFVERNPVTGIYRPGIRFLQLAYLTQENNDLRRVSLPYMQRLCAQFLENVNLAQLDGSDVVYIEITEGSQRIKLAASPGQRLPTYCTASGKAIIAYLPADAVDKILGTSIQAHTACTMTSREEIISSLEVVQKTGFALDLGELEEGINAVAAPILDKDSRPLASISVAGPAYRLTKDRMSEIGPVVRKTADEISREIQRVPGIWGTQEK
jgi:IclR family acetate operon transcriptional repressor